MRWRESKDLADALLAKPSFVPFLDYLGDKANINKSDNSTAGIDRVSSSVSFDLDKERLFLNLDAASAGAAGVKSFRVHPLSVQPHKMHLAFATLTRNCRFILTFSQLSHDMLTFTCRYPLEVSLQGPCRSSVQVSSAGLPCRRPQE